MTVYTQQANEWDTASTLRSPGKGELIGFAGRKRLCQLHINVDKGDCI